MRERFYTDNASGCRIASLKSVAGSERERGYQMMKPHWQEEKVPAGCSGCDQDHCARARRLGSLTDAPDSAWRETHAAGSAGQRQSTAPRELLLGLLILNYTPIHS